MNSAGYALLHNFFFFLGFVYYLDSGDALTGFGIIGVGILLGYFLDDVVCFSKNIFIFFFNCEEGLRK